MKFQVITAVSKTFTVFWDIASCSVVEITAVLEVRIVSTVWEVIIFYNNALFGMLWHTLLYLVCRLLSEVRKLTSKYFVMNSVNTEQCIFFFSFVLWSL
jgi:hypothetical protein